jgi:hypothetical protein
MRGPGLAPVAFVWLQTAATPGLEPDYGAGVSFEGRAARFNPWLLIGAAFGGDSQVSLLEPGVGARLSRFALVAVGCPLRFPDSGYFSVRPCLALDVAWLTAEGVGVERAERRTAPWAALGPEVHGVVELPAGLEAGLVLGGLVPLNRPRFYFQPAVEAFHVDRFGLRVGSYIALRL